MKKYSYRTQNQRGHFSRTKTKIHNQQTQIDSETCKREQKIRAETKISKKQNKNKVEAENEVEAENKVQAENEPKIKLNHTETNTNHNKISQKTSTT